MFQPEGSNGSVDERLMVFEPTVVNRGIESSYFVEYLPTNQINDDGPIEFAIPPSGSMYIDFSKTTMCIKAKIVKADGTNLGPKDVVTPINLFFHTMFQQVDTYLQQKLISSSSTNYSYKAMLDTLLFCGTDFHNTALQSQLFYKDTAGAHNNVLTTGLPINQGFIRRNLLAQQSKEFDMEGPILSDIFQIDKYLINGLEVRVKLWPQKNNFRLMWEKATESYKVKIISACIKVFYINVSPGVILGHAEALKHTNARYHYFKSDIKTYTIAAGSFNVNLDDIFQGSIPSRAIVCMVKSSAYAGKHNENPMKFDHFNLDFIGTYINGESKPFKPLQPNFSTTNGQQYIKAYQTLLPSIKGHQGSIVITRLDYPLGYTIFVFDNNQHNEKDKFPIVRHGNFRIEAHFSSGLSEAVNIIVYGQFPSVLEVDSARNVLL